MKALKYNILTIVFCLLMVFTGNSQDTEKIKGLSFVGANSPIDDKDVKPIIEMNANWVTLMPYGFVGKDGEVVFNSKWQWWGETTQGIRKTVELCQKRNLKIMLKPQVWMMRKYTGDYKLATTEEWERFENSYKAFILYFLKIAKGHDLELFCIGTEWREFIAARPGFWDELIQTTREIYNGKITYAANWDDYDAVPFWSQLDYIGVNGYFPVSYSEKPTLEELKRGWEIQREKLARFSEGKDKGIILTEIGYRSMVGATVKPWEHTERKAYSAEIQDYAYQALFSVLWGEEWFEGMFIWKWYHNHEKQGGEGDLDFTPQNKSAARTIRNFWK